VCGDEVCAAAVSYKAFLCCDFCGEETLFDALIRGCGASYPDGWTSLGGGAPSLASEKHVCPECIRTLRERKASREKK
jgi:hypothetical protein